MWPDGRLTVLPAAQIYEGVSSLLDKLGVWYHLANGTSDLKEMAQTGLRILVGYIMLQDPQVGHPFLGLRVRFQPLGQGRWPHLMSHVPPPAALAGVREAPQPAADRLSPQKG